MRRSGLDRKLDNLADFFFVDAPHPATGPAPADVSPFFPPPYREWWNATEDPETKKTTYVGVEETLEYVCQYIRTHGPFDGLWAFSQGTMLATILISLQRQGKLLQDTANFRFAVFFGGFHNRQKLKKNELAQQVFRTEELLDIPSVHVIGERDSIRKLSLQLMEEYKDPIFITHPRGHTIPALDEESFRHLEGFLKSKLANISELYDSEREDEELPSDCKL